jgi:hypothetical protein
VTYYTAPDSSSEPSWTGQELGTAQSTTPSNIYSSNSQLEIGSNLGGGSPLTGTIYRAIVRSGIGGTTVFDANFATAAADALAFNESSNNATVTITSTRYAYGVPGVSFSNVATQSLSANTVYYAAFEVTAPLTLDFMAMEVSTAAAGNGTLRLGIYAADSNLQPTGAPLFDSGDLTVTSGAVGILSKQGTAVTLQPGVYLSAVNTSVALTARAYIGGQSFVPTAMGAALNVIVSATQTTGAFPTPGTPWIQRANSTTGLRHIPVMRWRSA